MRDDDQTIVFDVPNSRTQMTARELKRGEVFVFEGEEVKKNNFRVRTDEGYMMLNTCYHHHFDNGGGRPDDFVVRVPGRLVFERD